MLFFCWEKDKNSALPPPYIGVAEKQTSASCYGHWGRDINSDSRSVVFEMESLYAAQVV